MNIRAMTTVFFLTLAMMLVSCSGNTSQDYLTEGRKLLEQGNPGGAVVLFKSALEKNPGEYALQFELGRAYFMLGKFDQAETEYQKCYRQQPDDPKLNLAIAELHVARNNATAALVHLGQFEKASGPSSLSRELAGLALYKDNRPDEARQALEESIALDGSRVMPRLELARFYVLRGNPEKARGLIEDALAKSPNDAKVLRFKADLIHQQGNNAEAYDAYVKVVAQDRYDEYARYMVGMLLLQAGKDEEAEKALKSMQADLKDSPQALILEGMLAARKNDYPAAAALFQRSVAIRPSLDGYFRLGVALQTIGDLESALSQFRIVVDKVPDYVPARRLIASILMMQGRVDEATREAELILEKRPNDAVAHLVLGKAYLAKGDNAKAEKEFETTFALDPSQTAALLQVGAIRLADGRTREAYEDLQMAVSSAPDNLLARTAMYNFHLARRETVEAEKVVLEGLNGSKQDAVLYCMLVPLYAGMNDEPKALDAIAKAHKADPAFADAYMLGFKLHAAAGRNEQALAECDAFLAQNPNAQAFLMASGALLDLLGRSSEADARFAKALEGHDPRVVVLVAGREIAAGRVEKGTRMLEQELATTGNPQLREALALQYVREKQLSKALALYDAIEVNSPRDAAMGKYRLQTMAGLHADAAATGQRLMEREPASPLGALLMATAHERMGKREEGLRELDEAYRKHQSPELLIALGAMSERGGDLAKAENYYRSGLKIREDYEPALMGLANVLMLRGEYGPSIGMYERVLRVQPDNVVALNNLAMAYVEKGKDPRKALQYALQAYVLLPDSVDVLDTVGTALLANGRAEEAVRAYVRALELMPDNPTLRYRLAEAHFKAGQKEQATNEVRAALQGVDFKEAAKARELLKKLGN